MQQVGSQYREHLRITEEEARQSFDALRVQQASLESQLAAASRIACEEAQEASNRKHAADERLRQTEVQADELHNQIKGFPTFVRSLINRSDRPTLLLTMRKHWLNFKARTLLMR